MPMIKTQLLRFLSFYAHFGDFGLLIEKIQKRKKVTQTIFLKKLKIFVIRKVGFPKLFFFSILKDYRTLNI